MSLNDEQGPGKAEAGGSHVPGRFELQSETDPAHRVRQMCHLSTNVGTKDM